MFSRLRSRTRLRKISSLRSRFGAPGVIAVIALVLAMAGGALAASGALSGKQKKEVEKIAKKFAGAPGSAGPAGPAGPAGAGGGKGATGGQGKTGATGHRGSTGSTGEEGETGATGTPWPVGGTLPSKATETGAWSIGLITSGAKPAGPETINAPISFTVPLATPLTNLPSCDSPGEPACQLHFILPNGKELNSEEEEVDPVECENGEHAGTASAENPEAKSGNLCVFAAKLSNVESFNPDIFKPGNPSNGTPGASVSGAMVGIEITAASARAYGTWAVTG